MRRHAVHGPAAPPDQPKDHLVPDFTPVPEPRSLQDLLDLKGRVDTDAYVVDPLLVADALLHWDGPRLVGVDLSSGDARTPSAPLDRRSRAA